VDQTLARHRFSNCRANDCFRTFITAEGSPRSGSLSKKMNVLGHDNISHHHETVPPAVPAP